MNSSSKAAGSSSDRAKDAREDNQDGGPMQLSRTKSRARDPPPALFLHPSPAASHVSIPGIPPAAAGGAASSSTGVPPLPRQKPPQSRRHTRDGSLTVSAPSVNRPSSNLKTRESTRSAGDRTDALWAEMQATLEEVELSASGGTHVFGPDHDRKLADLRAAQIALAQAWARSEADDAIGPGHRDGTNSNNNNTTGLAAAEEELRNLKGAVLSEATRSGAPEGGTDGAKSTAGTASGRPGSSGGQGPGHGHGHGSGADRLGAKLEEETEADILLARKRREANDRYFQKVNQGVVDVVARLDEVAVAMRAVEQESKDIWGESDGLPESPNS